VTTFVDSSALYGLLSAEDPNNKAAAAWFRSVNRDPSVVTHNYVVVETTALLQRRLGPGAVRAFLEYLLSPIEVLFVDEQLHRLATSAFLAAVRRRPSLVDWVSFELMRREGIRRAFAFDRDFRTQGFTMVP
jgi:predicted nucleic acid-binding protein